ncbi:zinc-binding alcohol dehydrogenase family protein [Tuwongella immobilis]|uniref:Enoyl reductase (ER) domain-containing protein n=1 Tax=Tuwongella immobilis TaxID=692036 RepID=A0A6C2YHC1_9BACT|nr:zinc-binding alcohol dehydrogenase family protein [Tuwongella immobilis]VIP00886.1 alcohol dehydrogenase domain protein : Alcohol dehydrogenase GroES domain protein OS=Opitutus terrae (strain DSM 11246 / PB90-1) GN=Oter_1421 PE=4 SV=1: ADH_N: ADH_zinc_N [Tuwongella immobilis]VTR97190.1 alcohol dehydrogenase domain protein : Alcohol dehydrogenase GroES domain protein OS=Opitutus terrae (strain DSM 11246 / PB90-1) GN=Oter_1421 PE=4 SV=1: ADH_N: ADH_zinc_N [Tuwongella immobilis]
MQQITLTEPGRFVADSVEAPGEPPIGFARVRIHRIGVCGTDLHAFAGRQPFFRYPRILGHELGVEVLAVGGDTSHVAIGDRCAIEPYLNCGVCHACVRNKPNCCERLEVLGVHSDGGMRGQILVPIAKLHPSENLTWDQLALVETLGIGQHAVERAQLHAGESVVIVGAGPIGLATLQFAKAAGAQVTVLEPNPMRRAFVQSTFGVDAREPSDDHCYDVVFDATGNIAAMEASVARVAFGGKLVFVGLVQGRISFDDPLFHRREMTILASRNSANAFPTIMRMIESGTLDTTPWITHRLLLSEVPSRFPELPRIPELVKAMIEVTDVDADA